MSLSIRRRLERSGELGASDSDTTCKKILSFLTIKDVLGKNLQVVVCKVEVGETGESGQGVGGEGDDGVVGEVEGGEGEQAPESPVLHLLHSVPLQAEPGQAGKGGEGVAGQPADGVEGEVEGAKVGGEEVKGGRGEGV